MAEQTAILKVRYTPRPGTDLEHGQGAIERAELPHAPQDDVTWLVRVPSGVDAGTLRKRLDAIVGGNCGSFTVAEPSADELARVERGEVRFQQ